MPLPLGPCIPANHGSEEDLEERPRSSDVKKEANRTRQQDEEVRHHRKDACSRAEEGDGRDDGDPTRLHPRAEEFGSPEGSDAEVRESTRADQNPYPRNDNREAREDHG